MIHVTAEHRDEVDWCDPKIWAIDYQFADANEYAAAYSEAVRRADETKRPYHLVAFTEGVLMVEFLDHVTLYGPPHPNPVH